MRSGTQFRAGFYSALWFGAARVRCRRRNRGERRLRQFPKRDSLEKTEASHLRLFVRKNLDLVRVLKRRRLLVVGDLEGAELEQPVRQKQPDLIARVPELLLGQSLLVDGLVPFGKGLEEPEVPGPEQRGVALRLLEHRVQVEHGFVPWRHVGLPRPNVGQCRDDYKSAA